MKSLRVGHVALHHNDCRSDAPSRSHHSRCTARVGDEDRGMWEQRKSAQRQELNARRPMPLGSTLQAGVRGRGGVRTSWPDRVPTDLGPPAKRGNTGEFEECDVPIQRERMGGGRIRATASAWSPSSSSHRSRAIRARNGFVGEEPSQRPPHPRRRRTDQDRMSLWASRFEKPAATESPRNGAPRRRAPRDAASRSGPKGYPFLGNLLSRPHRPRKKVPRMVWYARKASSSSGTCSERSRLELHRLVAVPDRGQVEVVCAQTPEWGVVHRSTG